MRRRPPLRPRAARGRAWQASPATGVLFANLGVALCCHFNAPSFYRTLAAQAPHATARAFRSMTYGAFALVFLLTLLLFSLTLIFVISTIIVLTYKAQDRQRELNYIEDQVDKYIAKVEGDVEQGHRHGGDEV